MATSGHIVVFLSQKFVSVTDALKVKTAHCWCWILMKVCAVATPSLYVLNKSFTRVDKSITVGSYGINLMLFADNLMLVASSEETYDMHL